MTLKEIIDKLSVIDPERTYYVSHEVTKFSPRTGGGEKEEYAISIVPGFGGGCARVVAETPELALAAALELFTIVAPNLE